jgi:hypothetical protein
MTFMASTDIKKEPIKIVRGTKNSLINESEQKTPVVDENTEVESLNHQFKIVNINLEPYIEDYVLENYFKLYKLQAFQTKGI